MTPEQIENTLTYRSPKGTQADRYELIRQVARDLAHVIRQHAPDSREKSLAFTNLQQTVMWANAAIAINE